MHFCLLLLWFLTALSSNASAQEIALTVTEPSGVERGWIPEKSAFWRTQLPEDWVLKLLLVRYFPCGLS